MGGGVGSRKQFTKSTDYCHGLHSIYSQIAGLVPGNGGNPKLMIMQRLIYGAAYSEFLCINCRELCTTQCVGCGSKMKYR